VKITRTRARASGALATGLAAALAFSTLVATPATAAPAPQAVPAAAGASTVSDAVFHWGINNEVSNRAFAPGTYNFMSAGKAPKTSGADTISEGEWSATDGNVTIEKKQADGTSYGTATWAGLKTTPTGGSIPSPSSGQFSGHRVAIAAGTGTLDAEADNADIQWDGDFTVAFYSGMTQFYVTDPHLVVEGGVGSVTATLSGYGSDMNEPDVFVTLPATEVTLADLSGVDVTDTGIEVTPDYLGVTANLPETATPQSTTGNSWGAFPESMIGFQLLTGQSSYWYSSGGATDAFKVALPISIGYTAVAPEPAATITAQPVATSVEAGSTATFQVTATGTELAYQWQKRPAGGEWADIAGATAATLSLPTTSADDAAQVRVVINGTLVSDAATLTVTTPTPQPGTITAATVEFGFNEVHQGASPAGGCNYFVAGKVQGLGSDYQAIDGDVYVVKKLADGSSQVVSVGTRCTAAEGSTSIDQRFLFTAGHGTSGAEGTEIQWTGAGTVNAYGGLVSWYFEDPKLELDASGNGTITARVGGFGSSMDDPTVKVPLDPRENVEIATVKGATVVDGTLTIDPVYTGVDYFPLSDVQDPTSARTTTSAIPQAAKTANPNWGSWPESFVDFQYATGLSSYWHTSGLSADPLKPPLPITVALEGSVPDYGVLFTREPVSAVLSQGDDVTFSAAAISQTGTPTLQWQAKKAGGDWADIAGETSGSLVLTGVTVADWNGASVRAVATQGDITVTSAAATLTVTANVAPVFTRQPADYETQVESSAYFEAAATGYPTPTYQWQRQDADGVWVDLANATNKYVSVYPVGLADSGSAFRVIATNGSGSTISDVAHLTVVEVPLTLVQQPKNLTVFDGGTGYLAAWFDGAPYPTFQWERSLDGTTWEDVAGATDNVLDFGVVTADAARYTYRLKASNTTGTAGLTTITTDPVTVTLLTQGDSPIHAAPTENLDPSVDNTIAITLGQLPAIPSGSSNLFRIGLIEKSAWQPGDAAVAVGSFVSASNYQGDLSYYNTEVWVPAGTLDPAKEYGIAMFLVPSTGGAAQPQFDQWVPITVASGVAIGSQPVNATVDLGQTASFTVTASGNPTPTYQWQSKSGSGSWTDVAGATSATYTFTPTLAQSGSAYRVVVSNSTGTVTSTEAALTVNRPTPTVTVSKTAGLDPNGETVTVTGSGFFPDGTTTNGARPPLAGQFTGVYVVFGKFADTWKPSDNAASSARTGIDTKWAVPASAVETIGGASAGAVELKADGTFTTTLTVKSGAFDKTGTYGVYTYGGGGVKYAPFETKTVLTLTEAAPVITTQPADSSASVYPETGETTFTVAASGSPTPTIQWQTKAAGGEWTAIEGATAATLGIAYTKADDGVQYRAVVTNGLGSVTSDAATLHITRPTPTVTVSKTTGLDPNGETVTVTGSGFFPDGTTTNGARPPLAGKFAGAYVVFGKFADTWKPSENAASSARTTLDVKWGVSAADIETIGGASAGAIEIKADGTFSTTLTIKSGAFDKTGTYGVYTYGGGGVKYAPFETKTVVTLNEAAPALTGQPGSVVAPVTPAAGPATAEFTVGGVTGSPAPTIQWQQKATGGDWTAIDGATAATLSKAYTAGDTGTQYRAVVTNGLGSVTSDAATLTVGVPVSITTAPVAASVTAGGENTFTAVVAGDPAPAVKWQSRGASGVWTDIPSETGTSLTVAALVDGVDYRIVASNGIPTTVGGTPLPVASDAARLTVTAPVETPELLTEEELAAASAGPVTIVSIDGSTVVLSLGAEFAGQFVAVEVHSVPQSLGWTTVSAAGTITVTLPSDLPVGTHTLVVRAADGSVIGTAGITVSAVDPGTGGTGGTDGTGSGTGTTGSGTAVTATPGSGSIAALSDTGLDSTGWLVFALLMLLAGAGVVATRRVRRS